MKRFAPSFEVLGSIATISSCTLLIADFFGTTLTQQMNWLSPLLLIVGICLQTSAIFLRRQEITDFQELTKTLNQRLENQRITYEKEIETITSNGQEDMERFRSMLSHGMRMPLAIVQGYVELMVGNIVTDTQVQKEYLNKILQRCKDIGSVVNQQLSTLSSINQNDLSYSSIDLISLLRHVSEDMQTAADVHDISIQVVSPEPKFLIKADPCHLNRIIFNLLENSIKYMNRSGVITIRVTRDGDNACIMVKDDGMGLPAEEAKLIFDINYQGSNNTLGSGSGYGLYLVRQIVLAHGGTICAESDIGRGMGVFITLPIQPIQQPKAT